MPQIFKIGPYTIFFWSNEGNPLEPIHVHIAEQANPNATKVWITAAHGKRNKNQHPRTVGSGVLMFRVKCQGREQAKSPPCSGRLLPHHTTGERARSIDITKISFTELRQCFSCIVENIVLSSKFCFCNCFVSGKAL